jgi:hypothetical protein
MGGGFCAHWGLAKVGIFGRSVCRWMGVVGGGVGGGVDVSVDVDVDVDVRVWE